MSANGQVREADADGQVLRWTGRVVAADDLRRSLNGHRELLVSPRAIITPLAAEELRARGVYVTRQPAESAPAAGTTWGVAQDRLYPQVASAVQGLRRDGLFLKEMPACADAASCSWSRALAECVSRGECRGGVVFCHDPGLVCCVANKVAGLRAVAVVTVTQAAQALLTLGPNLVAVEMPGRTFFEIRQILRSLCVADAAACPDGVACTLRELDGHAHR
jgi:hypothetical protein